MSFAGNLSDKYGRKILDAATETGLDAAEIDSKKVVHNPAEATGALIRNKIAEDFVKPKPVVHEYSRNIKEINIPLKKRKEISNEMEHQKISKD